MGKHGKPDWGLQLKNTVYSMDDLSELAARLGSPVFFDRRGDVLFMDSFEGGLSKWRTYGSGTDNKQIISADRVKSGGYSAKLVGGKTTPWHADMWIFLPYPVLSKCGLELHFCMPELIDKMIIEFIVDTATYQYEAVITYDRTNKKLQYKDSEGEDQDIETSFILYEYASLFHVLKLVADFETNKYHRLILNETTHDLSAHGMEPTSTSGAKYIEVKIWLYSRDGHNDAVYIDNVIVTQNEP